ncbi:hypothetical protein [Shewanella fodinae]|uniref:hypothetical protein n=1 Tax=Shewanella fodinae TaxID=552357 RepID=UPI0016737A19|nr:hypothetical protein [Shewanella fodinae]MCL2908071.1 hypothetical protein [Shewanella fodinae]GGZ13021.1 hypothetical protein GCM10007169_32110 [Shewanella fodinae]
MDFEYLFINELLNAYPSLAFRKGYIFIGSLEDEAPYSRACFQSWRLVGEKVALSDEATFAIDRVITDLIDRWPLSVGRPHGIFQIEPPNITFKWASSDIVETMLAELEEKKVPKKTK